MRRRVLLAVWLFLASLLAGAPAVAAPCVNATAACAQWVPLAGGKARSMVYASSTLDAPSPAIRRVLIMVHGTLRNADHYFATATGAAFLAGALDDTLVIAPAFRSADRGCDDVLAPGEVGWSCHGDSWRSGGASTTNPELTSFDLIDTLVKTLADRRLFPNLGVVVIAGHSAGGQFVARYNMANRIDGAIGVRLEYVVANPSSYAWPDATRPLPEGDDAPTALAKAWTSETPHTHFQYAPFDSARAKSFDRWPFGLEGRKSGYTAGMSDDLLREQLATRPVTYLLGQVDVLPLGGFDDSPDAMAQGPTRRARGEAFANYIKTRLGAAPRVMIVPECGHNDRCVFTTDMVLPVIFPKIEP